MPVSFHRLFHKLIAKKPTAQKPYIHQYSGIYSEVLVSDIRMNFKPSAVL